MELGFCKAFSWGNDRLDGNADNLNVLAFFFLHLMLAMCNDKIKDEIELSCSELLYFLVLERGSL